MNEMMNLPKPSQKSRRRIVVFKKPTVNWYWTVIICYHIYSCDANRARFSTPCWGKLPPDQKKTCLDSPFPFINEEALLMLLICLVHISLNLSSTWEKIVPYTSFHSYTEFSPLLFLTVFSTFIPKIKGHPFTTHRYSVWWFLENPNLI